MKINLDDLTVLWTVLINLVIRLAAKLQMVDESLKVDVLLEYWMSVCDV